MSYVAYIFFAATSSLVLTRNNTSFFSHTIQFHHRKMEDKIFEYLGTEGYFYFTIDKVITHSSKYLAQFAADAATVAKFLEFKSKCATKRGDVEYRSAVLPILSEISPATEMIRVDFTPLHKKCAPTLTLSYFGSIE